MKNEIQILEDLLARNIEAKKRLSLELAPLLKKQDKLFKQGKEVKELLDLAIIKNENPSWEWILFEDSQCSQARYNYAGKRITELGLMTGGYYPDTQQKALQIALVNGKRETAEKAKKAIETLLPYVKEHTKEDYKGYKVFSILEHSCSENGSHALLIGKNEFIVNRMYYHRPEVLQKCKTLEHAIAYIYSNLYCDKIDDKLDSDFEAFLKSHS